MDHDYRFKHKRTIDLLKEFTEVAESVVCRPDYDAYLEKYNKRTPKFLRNVWPFKVEPYTERGLFAIKDIPKGTYLGTYGFKLNDDINPSDLSAKEEQYVLRRIDLKLQKVF
ncbi:MAG: hypothetical protein AAF182_04810, partial [Pseudomonadota bacterium]